MTALKRRVFEGESEETKRCHLLCHSSLGTVELGMERALVHWQRKEEGMDGWREGRGQINEVEMRGNSSCATAGLPQLSASLATTTGFNRKCRVWGVQLVEGQEGPLRWIWVQIYPNIS